MLQFLQVFFVPSAILIPRQSLLTAGCEIFFVTAFGWLGQLVSLIGYARMRSGHPAKWLAQRILTAHIASIPLFTASVMLMLGNSAGIFVIMGGFFFSFVAGIIGAWILLIEILR